MSLEHQVDEVVQDLRTKRRTLTEPADSAVVLDF
jgi:DNA polymerase-3 subunit epsilon